MLSWAGVINRLYNIFGSEAMGGGRVCSMCSHVGIFICRVQEGEAGDSFLKHWFYYSVPIFLCASLQLVQTQSTFSKPFVAS